MKAKRSKLLESIRSNKKSKKQLQLALSNRKQLIEFNGKVYKIKEIEP